MDYLESSLYDRPLRAIDHDGDPRDVRFGNNQVEEPGHACFPVEHCRIEVDVDYVGSVFNLLLGDLEGGFVILVLDQLPETG